MGDFLVGDVTDTVPNGGKCHNERAKSDLN